MTISLDDASFPDSWVPYDEDFICSLRDVWSGFCVRHWREACHGEVRWVNEVAKLLLRRISSLLQMRTFEFSVPRHLSGAGDLMFFDIGEEDVER